MLVSLTVVQLVVKSQILAGGRGLGKFKDGFQGGVHIVKVDKVEETAGNEDWNFIFFLSLSLSHFHKNLIQMFSFSSGCSCL